MFQLICALLGLALVGISLTATVSYVNPTEIQAQAIADRLESNLQDLKTGFEAFQDAHGGVAPAIMSQVAPNYVFIPPTVGATSWSFGSNFGARYFCLSGTFPPSLARAALLLRDRFSPQAYFINTSCGAITNNLPASSTATFAGAVTLWMTSPY